MHEGESITRALHAAGLGELPTPAKAWAADRLSRYGYSREARNIGALQCTIPHDHTDGSCVPVVLWTGGELTLPHAGDNTVSVSGGQPRNIARCGSWEHAARLFVATAARAGASPETPAADLPLVGFRSAHPADHELQEATGDFREFVKQVAPAVLSPLTTQLLFGPSAEAEAAFRGLLGDWESFEKAGVPDKVPELRDTHAAWVKFRDAWLGGNPDELNLNAMITDANRVRLTLAEKTKDPKWQQGARKNVETTNLARDLNLAQKALDIANETPLVDPWDKFLRWFRALPWKYQVGIGGGAVVLVGGVVMQVTAPLLLTLAAARPQPQVVVVQKEDA